MWRISRRLAAPSWASYVDVDPMDSSTTGGVAVAVAAPAVPQRCRGHVQCVQTCGGPQLATGGKVGRASAASATECGTRGCPCFRPSARARCGTGALFDMAKVQEEWIPQGLQGKAWPPRVRVLSSRFRRLPGVCAPRDGSGDARRARRSLGQYWLYNPRFCRICGFAWRSGRCGGKLLFGNLLGAHSKELLRRRGIAAARRPRRTAGARRHEPTVCRCRVRVAPTP